MFMIEKDGSYFDWFWGKFIQSKKPLKEQHTRHYRKIQAAFKSMIRFEDVDFVGARVICVDF